MKFFEASKPKVGKKHVHVVYVNEKTGVYEVSEANGHRHNVILQEDGSFIVEPDPMDGHFHETLREIEHVYPKRPEASDDEVVSRLYKFAKSATEWAKISLKKAKSSDKMYKGDQWEDGEKKGLEADGRAALVINMIERYIDDLVGYQRQQRTDPVALPIGESDQILCDIANELIKVILYQNSFEFTESGVFEDGCICGVGAFGVEVSQKDDIRGDLRIKRWPYDQVFYGEHLETDLEDCEFLIKTQRWSIDKLKAKHKAKIDDLESTAKLLEDKLGDELDTDGTQHSGDEYIHDEDVRIPYMVGDNYVYNKARKEVLVVELEEKIYIPVTVIYDAVAEETLTTYGWSDAHLKQISTIANLYTIDKEIQKMRIVRTAGSVLLLDDYIADIPDDDFTIVPFYAKKRGSDFWGKVESGKDAQKEFNKRVSQSVDVVNFASLYGIVYDENTFTSTTEETRFKESGNKPGFITKVADIRNKPELFQGIKLPSEIMAVADTSEARLERMMSVDATRFAGANTSAYAIQQARESALVGNEYLFMNMKRSKKNLIKKAIAYIQKYYSAKRIYRILSEQNKREPIQLGQQSFEKYPPEEIIGFLENSDMTKIDIVIDETSWSPTQRAATLNVIQELAKSGFPVPPQMIPELLNVPKTYKDGMLQTIMQQQESEAASAEGTQDTEVVKSLIGQGQIPPKVLEKYGLAPAQVPQGMEPEMPQGPLPLGIQAPPIQPMPQ
jgi:hypothetical protein